MESVLFVLDLLVMLLLIVWSAREDGRGTKLSGRGLFDYRPGAECDDAPVPTPPVER